MRLEGNKDGTAKVWLSESEYERLRRAADDQTTVAIRLGAECGLRHAEAAAVTPGDLRDTMLRVDGGTLMDADAGGNERVLVHWLEVHGKDTTGGSKRRDAFVPERVADELALCKARRGLSEDDPYIEVSARTVRRWISDLGDELAAETGNDDWTYLSSHDLRRYYATRLLQVHGMNPEVVMEVGGWDSYEALRPYLQSPVQEVIAAEFASAGLL